MIRFGLSQFASRSQIASRSRICQQKSDFSFLSSKMNSSNQAMAVSQQQQNANQSMNSAVSASVSTSVSSSTSTNSTFSSSAVNSIGRFSFARKQSNVNSNSTSISNSNNSNSSAESVHRPFKPLSSNGQHRFRPQHQSSVGFSSSAASLLRIGAQRTAFSRKQTSGETEKSNSSNQSISNPLRSKRKAEMDFEDGVSRVDDSDDQRETSAPLQSWPPPEDSQRKQKSAEVEAAERFASAVLSEDQQIVKAAILSGRNVFFTGAAGTGKSFLLQYLIHQLPSDTTFVTAATGMAAVGIQGTTLHSFAGCGLAELPGEQLVERVKNSRSKMNWKKVKTLIIDEVSMVDSDFFDKLELIARRLKGSNLPFGRIQLVLTGDFLQLPPVSKGSEPKFAFESSAWQRCQLNVIELKQVFRQSDDSLVSVLNTLRRGRVTDSVRSAMRNCINRQFPTADGIEATKLYSRKGEVNSENEARLAALEGDVYEFNAVDSGLESQLQIIRRNPPVSDKLEFKVGAQVILLKNHRPEAGLVNGSRGVILDWIDESDVDMWSDDSESIKRCSRQLHFPKVRFTNGIEEVIRPSKWTIMQRGKEVARRLQLPLQLAYALTVHKAQGMTLDRVRLNLNTVFESGQAYVALSRIRSLESLSLESFPEKVVKANAKALHFYETVKTIDANEWKQWISEDRTKIEINNSTNRNSTNRIAASNSNPFEAPPRLSGFELHPNRTFENSSASNFNSNSSSSTTKAEPNSIVITDDENSNANPTSTHSQPLMPSNQFATHLNVDSNSNLRFSNNSSSQSTVTTIGDSASNANPQFRPSASANAQFASAAAFEPLNDSILEREFDYLDQLMAEQEATQGELPRVIQKPMTPNLTPNSNTNPHFMMNLNSTSLQGGSEVIDDDDDECQITGSTNINSHSQPQMNHQPIKQENSTFNTSSAPLNSSIPLHSAICSVHQLECRIIQQSNSLTQVTQPGSGSSSENCNGEAGEVQWILSCAKGCSFQIIKS